MPYPPRKPNKYASPEEARAASNTALVPHRFAPGRSGNLHGMSARQHAFYTEVRQLKSRLGPAVLERLAELAGLEIGEDGAVTKLPLGEVLRDHDPRVVFAATNSLRDQIFGKPREGMEEEVSPAGRIDFSRFSPEELERVHAVAQLLARARVSTHEAAEAPVIDAEAEPAPAE